MVTVTENPEIKTFAVHPGSIRTQLASDINLKDDFPMPDTLQLPAATMLYLASGNADWLSGRYVRSCRLAVCVAPLTISGARFLDAVWDLGEVEREWREKILAKNALVSKLSIP